MKPEIKRDTIVIRWEKPNNGLSDQKEINLLECDMRLSFLSKVYPLCHSK